MSDPDDFARGWDAGYKAAREALENSQKTLKTVYRMNTHGSVDEFDWENGGVGNLIRDQIEENRVALIRHPAQQPPRWSDDQIHFAARALALANPDSYEAKMPVFGARWHSWSRLDIRPVLWSLRNRPEEWEQLKYRLVHKPSNHQFWTANGLFFYSLHDANCSCTKVRGGGFSLIQKLQFAFARRHVLAIARRQASAELAQINAHFTEHFSS